MVESDGVLSVCVTADRGDGSEHRSIRLYTIYGSEIYTATLSTINITTQGMAH